MTASACARRVVHPSVTSMAQSRRSRVRRVLGILLTSDSPLLRRPTLQEGQPTGRVLARLWCAPWYEEARKALPETCAECRRVAVEEGRALGRHAAAINR